MCRQTTFLAYQMWTSTIFIMCIVTTFFVQMIDIMMTSQFSQMMSVVTLTVKKKLMALISFGIEKKPPKC